MHSLGYFSQKPGFSSREQKDLENMRNLGLAYSKLDDLLCSGKISQDEAKTKMKAILEALAKGLDYFLINEILKYNFVERMELVQDKQSYLINLLNMKKESNTQKVDYLINFLNRQIN